MIGFPGQCKRRRHFCKEEFAGEDKRLPIDRQFYFWNWSTLEALLNWNWNSPVTVFPSRKEPFSVLKIIFWAIQFRFASIFRVGSSSLPLILHTRDKWSKSKNFLLSDLFIAKLPRGFPGWGIPGFWAHLFWAAHFFWKRRYWYNRWSRCKYKIPGSQVEPARCWSFQE